MEARTPPWPADAPQPRPALPAESAYDDVVVGGGLTGLLTGLLLARAGRAVAVLEARRVGAGTTGHTTGKVSLLQGTRLSRVLRTNPPSVARAYVDAGREGLAWLRRFCDEHGVAVQERAAYTYATTAAGEARARSELAAAHLCGLGATWEEETELPYAVRGAARLSEQFQLDPRALTNALTEALLAEGGELFEGTRVLDVRRTPAGARVATEHASVDAGTVVLATNQPILLRHGFFARLRSERSYAAALRSPWVPHGMYLSADSSKRSLRSLVVPGGDDLLLVGGNGHPTGRSTPTSDRLEELLTWAKHSVPGSTVTHTWSAQDQATVTGLPYVGPMLPRDRTIHVATGFDKWGLSTAPAAALLLAARILGSDREAPAWGRAFASWTPREVAGAARAVLFNAEAGAQEGLGQLRAVGGGAAEPDEGEGSVRYEGLRPVASARVDGTEHRVSAVCSHLGGLVRWNDAERSWDCPLHGSRFAADGSVLEAPATCGLRQR